VIQKPLSDLLLHPQPCHRGGEVAAEIVQSPVRYLSPSLPSSSFFPFDHPLKGFVRAS
jgi:hypothetical protein